MIKKLIVIWLCCVLALTGCADSGPQITVYEKTYLDYFDTVTVLKGAAESQTDFDDAAALVAAELERYHKLFDIYNDYEGLNNLKTVNDMAGVTPVEVDAAIIALLTDCRCYYELTGGKVNAAMGGVLKLWHEARNQGLYDPAHAELPDMAALEQAAMHTDFDSIDIDEAACTVYISDPLVQLDVGAVAKGWAAQCVSEQLPTGMLLSLGGNVCATGPKAENTPWVIGVQNPAGEGYLNTLNVIVGSFVTSGDYQRTYRVNGVDYHHIIDPQTLMPSRHWRSVTVICDDSGLADALSTALFLLPQAEGQALLDQCGAVAMWVDGNGISYYSSGFEAYIRT